MAILLIILIIILIGLPALLVISACIGASRATRKEETIPMIARRPSRRSSDSKIQSPQNQPKYFPRPSPGNS
jgi:hypothetical protein